MKQRILLVDDDATILLTTRAILEMNGFEVETAGSAPEAEEKLRSADEFDLVITDMKMGRETAAGFDVVHAVRNQGYDAAIAILSAYPNLDADWKEEGADSFLIKPMSATELLAQIEALQQLREQRASRDKKKRPTQVPQSKRIQAG